MRTMTRGDLVVGFRIVLAVSALGLVSAGCTASRTHDRAAGPKKAAAITQASAPSDGIPVVTMPIQPLDGLGFPEGLPATVEDARKMVSPPANAWEELDDIYGLMALAVVHADWQEGQAKARRGHNIGGIVVDRSFEVVNWERNSNAAMCNGTQHGEVRLMLKQLNQTGTSTLDEHQIYTSLEPCMMCSGMMMQQGVLRTVYMQTDDGFGKNLERLTIDTREAEGITFGGQDVHGRGYPPAPRAVISNVSASEFRLELDVAWRKVVASKPGTSLTGWLRSDEAEDIYRRARAKFEHYPLRFPNERAVARFVVPSGKTPKELRAAKTNADLYAAALALFNAPERGVIPYADPDGAGPRTLEEARDNAFATPLLGAPDGVAPNPPQLKTLTVEGKLAGKPVKQKRVWLEKCPKN